MANAVDGDFWSPSFEITKREDGTVYMVQKDPLPEALPTIADYLDLWADKAPERTFLARRNDERAWDRLTYGESRDKALRLGSAFLEMGLGPDRPLLILSENSLEHALCALACTYVGIPFAPVSPAYSLISTDHKKLRDIVNLLQPGAIFADDVTRFTKALQAVSNDSIQTVGVRNLTAGSIALEELLHRDATGEGEAARAGLTGDTVLKYLFTSGSTGSPKAVINTNGMVTSNQALVRDCYRFMQTEPPVLLDWAPWNHTAAGNKVTYMVLTNGGTYYIDDGKPSPDGIKATVANLREVACNWYFNVPAGYDLLVGELEDDPELARVFFSQLKMLFYAGAGMSQNTWDRLIAVSKATTGKEILITSSLGATETGPFALTWTEPEPLAGKVGVPGRGLTLKLVPADDAFELRLKGASITPGYYGDPENTANAFDEEGFYKMGDALRPEDPNDLTRGFYFGGRLAENFKLATGTWVSVGSVRAALVDSMQGLVRDAIIVGEDQPELGALLWISEAGSKLSDAERSEKMKTGLEAHIQSGTGSASRVRRVAVLLDPPDLDKGELTEKGSINQRALRKNRASQIDALYASDGDILRL
ncbi:MAG: feruloyl-CoA synthase [Alphaproteobacteria bacterium]